MRIGIVHTFASPCACHVTLVRALAALGDEAVECDSEDVPRRAAELARLDLVFDQTDTFRGEGLLRPFVRQLLAARGVRAAGSGPSACFIADDKVATKERLAAAGVPTPPFALVTDAGGADALDLPYPRVVKPVFEHMSRGLALVRDAREERAALEAALRDRRGPYLVEAYVPGREIGITVLGNAGSPGERGLRALIAEWPLEGAPVLSYAAKRDGRDPVPASLAPDIERRLESLAVLAFAALGLADFARFDVRLAADGTPFFLEANVKPSLEAGSPTLVAAAAADLDETALVRLLRDVALARHGRKRS